MKVVVSKLGRSALLAMTVLACGSDPLGISLIAVDIEGPITVSVDAPVEFKITALNLSSDRVVWGRGSSSCQFGLVVEGESLDRQDISFRACTDDLAEQGLNPGDSRVEMIEWEGQISVSGLLAPLPAGVYHVIATLGDEFESEPLIVTVLGHPLETI